MYQPINLRSTGAFHNYAYFLMDNIRGNRVSTNYSPLTTLDVSWGNHVCGRGKMTVFFRPFYFPFYLAPKICLLKVISTHRDIVTIVLIYILTLFYGLSTNQVKRRICENETLSFQIVLFFLVCFEICHIILVVNHEMHSVKELWIVKYFSDMTSTNVFREWVYLVIIFYHPWDVCKHSFQFAIFFLAELVITLQIINCCHSNTSISFKYRFVLSYWHVVMSWYILIFMYMSNKLLHNRE